MRKHKPPPLDLSVSNGDSAVRDFEVSSGALSKPKVHFNWQDWTHFWEGLDWTDDQLRQLIEVHWDIIQAFLDLNCEVGPFEDETNVDKSSEIFNLTGALRDAEIHFDESRNGNRDLDATKRRVKETSLFPVTKEEVL